jgi:hypothetical protein
LLPLVDERWNDLDGGRRDAHDPRPALAHLERNERVEGAWAKLWDNLYHEGQVGLASYAAVPHLLRIHRLREVADWNTHAIVCSIELARPRGRNPAVPEWLRDGYESAWRELPLLALRDLARSEDPLLTRAALAVVAVARGLRDRGEALLELDDAELAELLATARGERA